jgi:hypothetical protein
MYGCKARNMESSPDERNQYACAYTYVIIGRSPHTYIKEYTDPQEIMGRSPDD